MSAEKVDQKKQPKGDGMFPPTGDLPMQTTSTFNRKKIMMGEIMLKEGLAIFKCMARILRRGEWFRCGMYCGKSTYTVQSPSMLPGAMQHDGAPEPWASENASMHRLF
jgi:hypothetical protein